MLQGHKEKITLAAGCPAGSRHRTELGDTVKWGGRTKDRYEPLVLI